MRADARINTGGLRVAQQEAHGINGVDAHVCQCAATRKARFGEPACWPPVGVHAISLGANDLAELTGLRAGAQPQHLWIKAPAVRHQQQGRCIGAGIQHGARFGGVQRHWFFHQHMHAGTQRCNRFWRVQVIGRAHHQHIHAACAQHFAHICMLARNAKLLRKLRHAFAAVVGDRHKLCAQIARSLRMNFGNVAGAGECNIHAGEAGLCGRAVPASPSS